MSTLKLTTEKSGNIYTDAYKAAKENPLFSEEDWDLAMFRDDLESYASMMLEDTSKIDASIFEGLTYDEKKAVLSNELYADKIKQFSPTDETTFEGTEYEYNKALFDAAFKEKQDYAAYENEVIAKQQIKGFKNFINTMIGATGELTAGILDSLSSALAIPEAVINGSIAASEGGSFEQGYKDSLVDSKLFAGDLLREPLMEFERNYTRMRDIDGNPTTFGQQIIGAANSIGQMLPMTLSYGIGAKGLKALGASAKVASIPGHIMQVMYYGNMFAGEQKQVITQQRVLAAQALEKGERFTESHLATIIGNAAAKTAVEWACEKFSSKLFGGSFTDKVVFGRGMNVNSTFFSLTANSSISEGLEEVITEFINAGIDALTSLWDDNYSPELSAQSVYDAYTVGAAISLVMGGAQTLTTRKYINDNGVKLSKVQSFVRQASINTITENLITADEQLSKTKDDKGFVVFSLETDKAKKIHKQTYMDNYAAIRVLAEIHASIGDARFTSAMATLNIVDKYSEDINKAREQHTAIAASLTSGFVPIDGFAPKPSALNKIKQSVLDKFKKNNVLPLASVVTTPTNSASSTEIILTAEEKTQAEKIAKEVGKPVIVVPMADSDTGKPVTVVDTEEAVAVNPAVLTSEAESAVLFEQARQSVLNSFLKNVSIVELLRTKYRVYKGKVKEAKQQNDNSFFAELFNETTGERFFHFLIQSGVNINSIHNALANEMKGIGASLAKLYRQQLTAWQKTYNVAAITSPITPVTEVRQTASETKQTTVETDHVDEKAKKDAEEKAKKEAEEKAKKEILIARAQKWSTSKNVFDRLIKEQMTNDQAMRLFVSKMLNNELHLNEFYSFNVDYNIANLQDKIYEVLSSLLNEDIDAKSFTDPFMLNDILSDPSKFRPEFLNYVSENYGSQNLYQALTAILNERMNINVLTDGKYTSLDVMLDENKKPVIVLYYSLLPYVDKASFNQIKDKIKEAQQVYKTKDAKTKKKEDNVVFVFNSSKLFTKDLIDKYGLSSMPDIYVKGGKDFDPSYSDGKIKVNVKLFTQTDAYIQSKLFHEVNHFIQDKLGLQRGSDPDVLYNEIDWSDSNTKITLINLAYDLPEVVAYFIGFEKDDRFVNASTTLKKLQMQKIIKEALALNVDIATAEDIDTAENIKYKLSIMLYYLHAGELQANGLRLYSLAHLGIIPGAVQHGVYTLHTHKGSITAKLPNKPANATVKKTEAKSIQKKYTKKSAKGTLYEQFTKTGEQWAIDSRVDKFNRDVVRNKLSGDILDLVKSKDMSVAEYMNFFNNNDLTDKELAIFNKAFFQNEYIETNKDLNKLLIGSDGKYPKLARIFAISKLLSSNNIQVDRHAILTDAEIDGYEKLFTSKPEYKEKFDKSVEKFQESISDEGKSIKTILFKYYKPTIQNSLDTIRRIRNREISYNIQGFVENVNTGENNAINDNDAPQYAAYEANRDKIDTQLASNYAYKMLMMVQRGVKSGKIDIDHIKDVNRFAAGIKNEAENYVNSMTPSKKMTLYEDIVLAQEEGLSAEINLPDKLSTFVKNSIKTGATETTVEQKKQAMPTVNAYVKRRGNEAASKMSKKIYKTLTEAEKALFKVTDEGYEFINPTMQSGNLTNTEINKNYDEKQKVKNLVISINDKIKTFTTDYRAENIELRKQRREIKRQLTVAKKKINGKTKFVYTVPNLGTTEGVEMPNKLKALFNTEFTKTHKSKTKLVDGDYIMSRATWKEFLKQHEDMLNNLTLEEAEQIIDFLKQSFTFENADSQKHYEAIRLYVAKSIIENKNFRDSSVHSDASVIVAEAGATAGMTLSIIRDIYATIKMGEKINEEVSKSLGKENIFTPEEVAIINLLGDDVLTGNDLKVLKDYVVVTKDGFVKLLTDDQVAHLESLRDKGFRIELPLNVRIQMMQLIQQWAIWKVSNGAYEELVRREAKLKRNRSGKDKGGLNQTIPGETDAEFSKRKKAHLRRLALKRINTFRYLAMLSNPQTWIRNTISNVSLTSLNFVSLVLDKGLKKIMGSKGAYRKGQYDLSLYKSEVSQEVHTFIQNNFNFKINEKQTFLDVLVTEQHKYSQIEKKTEAELLSMLENVMLGELNMKFSFGVGKSKAGKAAAKAGNFFAEFINRRLSDKKFILKSTVSVFGKLLQQSNINLALYNPDMTIRENRLLDSSLIEDTKKQVNSLLIQAMTYSFDKYMRSTNALSNLEQYIQEKSGAAYVAWKMLFPFARSSWNFFKEMGRLTSLGLVKSIYEFATLEKQIEKANAKANLKENKNYVNMSGFTEANIRQNLAKGVIGTVIKGIGVLLALFGMIGLDDEDDTLKIRIGDNMYISMNSIIGNSSIMSGAAIVLAIRNKESLNKVVNASLSTLMDEIFFNEVINTIKYGEEPLDYVNNSLYNFASSFIPNIWRSLVSIIGDNSGKTKYEKGLVGILEKWAEQLVPGLTYALPKQPDIYNGKIQSKYYVPFLQAAINKISPVQFYSYSISDNEWEAIDKGVSKGQLTGKYTINNEKVNMSTQDVEKINVFYGELNKASLDKLYSNKIKLSVQMPNGTFRQLTYNQMSDEQKKNAIENVMGKNATYSKIYYWCNVKNSKYYTTADERRLLLSLGIKNVYLKTSNKEGFVD